MQTSTIRQQYYISQINKVLDYIDQHLDKTFSLEELSAQALFSKYHFHRMFTAIVGEAPFQYILRLRLEKAASMIVVAPQKSLSSIAIECGFSDLSVFSRNFKKHFNQTPTAYKKSNKRQIQSNEHQSLGKIAPYFCLDFRTIKWRTNMDVIKNVEVRELSTMTVAYNRSFGPYQGNNELYQKHRSELFAWAAAKGIMANQNFKYLILYHDNPNVALNDNQRMSLCVTIPPNIEPQGQIGKMDIKQGKYLVCECELTALDFPKVWDWIYGQWFVANSYIPADKPYFELYPEQPKGEVFQVHFCIPVEVQE